MSSVEHVAGKLPGVILFKPRVFPDPRGFFTEVYHSEKYAAAGLPKPFVQDNYSRSKKHVLRGLHSQVKHPQGKLVYVVEGEIFDVAVDIRRGSPTFGQWEGEILSAENHHQLYVPEGFAHGFVVLSEFATVCYKCTDLYAPGDEQGFAWNDPDLAIDWPVKTPVLGEKDVNLPRLREVSEDRLPRA